MSIIPLYNMGISSWAIANLKNTCDKASSVFLWLRILLIANAISLTITISMITCYSRCYGSDKEIKMNKYIPLIYICNSIITLVILALLYFYMPDNCLSEDKDIINIIFNMVGLPVNAVSLVSLAIYIKNM